MTTKKPIPKRSWLFLLQLSFVLLMLMLMLAYGVDAQTLPTGFSRVQVASGLVQTTAMETLPDGRILVCEQSGKLRVIKNGTLLSTPAVTLTNVDFADEKGLIGVVADPAFTTNNFIYLYYTVKEGAEKANGFNRIVRYRMNGDVVDATSRTIIYDLSNLVIGTRYHSGGSMIFGKDGKLYVGTGENQQGSANSQNLDNTHGKILRMNPDGSIPTGNPFTGNGARSRIWVYGLRNAFTFDIDKITGKIYVNDVGGALREEINDATTSGRNFGWAEKEGTCTSGCTGYTNPIYDYFRENETTNQTYRIDQGCAITGGVFFNTPSNYPATYQGKYFFLDFCNNWINYIDPANTGAGIKNFAKMMGWHNVYLKVGADGNLYYLCRGPGRVNSNSIVYKIVFSGGTAPTITQQPANATVAQGDNVTFCVVASGSAPLSYQWRKNGVNISGATASCYTITNVQPSHAGSYSCVVTNGQGSATSTNATLTVTAPNAKPVATITAPPTNSSYRYGDVFNYAGDATDNEDGPLPASAFTWDLVLHHNTHTHNDANLPDGVKTGSFTANNDHIDGDVYYELFLSVTDSKGAIGMDSIRVNPITSNLTLQTNPAGLQIRFDLQPRPTPFTALVVSNTPTALEAISPQTVNGVTYIFDSWSNGSTSASTIITATDNDATYTANFKVAPAPVLLTPTHDAYVRNGIHAGTAHGTTDPTNLIIKRALAAQVDNTRETYVKYDLNSITGTPAVVQLRLFGRIEDATTTNLPVEVFSVANTTWTESAITWNTKPATSPSPLASTTVTDATARYYTWDVTNYVKTEFAAGRKVVSFAFKTATEHNPRTMWSSKETGTNPPQLSVIADTGGDGLPTANITSPANGATFIAPATITINADATDAGGSVTKVEFFSNSAKIGEDLTAPYSFIWNNVSAGGYSLTAIATDNDGNTKTSAEVAINVNNNTAPSVVITSPANGATFSAPAAINVTTNATDSDGTVVKVEFFVDNIKVCEDTSAPFSCIINLDSPGSYALHAVATDNLGATSTSPVNNIIIQEGSCPPVFASADDGNVPANVLDNNLSTRWSALGDPQWIQFCIDPAQYLRGVEIIFYNGNLRSSTFDVLVSTDGTTWTNAATTLRSSGTSTTWETFNFAPKFARHVRIVGHGNSVNLWNSYVEVRLLLGAPPSVSITSPASNASFTAPATVVIDADATDLDGTVTKVEFFQGATKLGESLTSPFSFTWSNVGAGSYSLTAKATDNSTLTKTSAAVPITVTSAVPCDPVTASADDGNVPANVLDNNLATRWSASGNPQWIQFCLASPSSVSAVQIAFYKGNERSSNFDVLVSMDGTSFTNASLNRSSSGTSLALETFSFPAQNAKYVRIVGHGNNLNLWNSYTEVKITTPSARLISVETPMEDEQVLSSFPNPTEGTATINYKVREEGMVMLSINNAVNNQKFILVNKFMQRGNYQTTFDTKPLPRGVHIIELINNGKLSTHKMVKK